MKFKDLRLYIEEEGCTFEEIFKGVFLVRNVINGHCCYVENLNFYSTPTLANYFHELQIAPHQSIEDFIHVYRTFRKGLK